jgi:hypothetical protein
MKVVLSVIDPVYLNRINTEEVAKDRKKLKSAIKLAERNGLYYYFILRLMELNIDLSFLEEERWSEEERKLSDFKKTVTLLNDVSKDYGIDYILIKACTTLPHTPRDVDIFVHNGDKGKIIKALEDKGMKCEHSDDVDTTLTKGEYMKVDIYTGLCYFTVDFIDGGFLWDSCVVDRIFGIDYPGLSEEANFLVMLVHSLFGHRSMSLLDFLHMKSLMDNIQDMDICRKYAYERGWGKAFDLALRKIEAINERIYKEVEVVHFPYLFDRKFVFQCISGVGGLDMTRVNKIFLHISFILDRVGLELEDTAIYNLLKSFEPTRRLFLSMGYFVRNKRGDKRSSQRDKGGRYS